MWGGLSLPANTQSQPNPNLGRDVRLQLCSPSDARAALLFLGLLAVLGLRFRFWGFHQYRNTKLQGRGRRLLDNSQVRSGCLQRSFHVSGLNWNGIFWLTQKCPVTSASFARRWSCVAVPSLFHRLSSRSFVERCSLVQRSAFVAVRLGSTSLPICYDVHDPNLWGVRHRGASP